MLVLSLFVCEAPHAFRLPQEKNVGNFLRIQQKTPPDLPPAFKIGKREAGGVRTHSNVRLGRWLGYKATS